MEKSLSLFGITTEIESIMGNVMENHGEIVELDEEKLKQLEESLKGKADGVVSWVKYQEALIDLAKNRIAELKEFIDRKNASLERFDKYVSLCMDKIGTSKFQGDLSAITKRKPSMVVEIEDETLLPLEFIKVPQPQPVIQKAEITKELKSGKEIPGARLVESKTISITYK